MYISVLHHDYIDDNVVMYVYSYSSCLSCQYDYRNVLTQRLTVRQSGTMDYPGLFPISDCELSFIRGHI